MTIAVTVSAYRLSDSSLRTLYFSDAGFTTAPTDVPANAYFRPMLVEAPSLARQMFDKAGSYGAASSRAGTIRLTLDPNADPMGADVPSATQLLSDYAFSGRAFSVRVGTIGTPHSSWSVAMTGTLDDAKFDGDAINLVVRDRMSELGKSLVRPTYAGSNVLPAGLEGTANDLKGQYKPRVYGKVFNVPAKAVNTSKLIYQVSDQAVLVSSVYVYDNGVTLTRGADYATLADVEATAPAAGQFRCYQGYFRLGSTPAAQVTADVSTTETRVASLLQQIALDAGIVTGDINAADVTALNALNAAPVGAWADGDVTPQSLMDSLAGSIGAWYGFDRLGALRMGRLDAPIGPPVVTWGGDALTALNIRELGVAAWQVTVRHSRNFTVQAQPAGSVTADRRAWLAQDYRQALQNDATVKTPWPAADSLTFDTALTVEADATAEATRRLALYKTRRLTLDAEIPLSELGAVDLGQVVAIDYPRYGFSNRLLRVIGIDAGVAEGVAKLTLWG
jgi:hypothetical protein